MDAILAVMNTIWVVVKITPEKNSGLYGPYFLFYLTGVHNCEDRFHIQIVSSNVAHMYIFHLFTVIYRPWMSWPDLRNWDMTRRASHVVSAWNLLVQRPLISEVAQFSYKFIRRNVFSRKKITTETFICRELNSRQQSTLLPPTFSKVANLKDCFSEFKLT